MVRLVMNWCWNSRKSMMVGSEVSSELVISMVVDCGLKFRLLVILLSCRGKVSVVVLLMMSSGYRKLFYLFIVIGIVMVVSVGFSRGSMMFY